ncbi:MAG: zinc ribbon domain-containing protein [Deltaproteobacteria bacterium]|nr:zinc ribbon domain-containing protein [Deltaproteobacteria bacterium]
MPIYEYFCADCNDVHEVSQRISEGSLVSCPKCSSPKVRKLISQSSFQLKGSGWYTTDYARTSTPSNGNGHAAASASTSPAGCGTCGADTPGTCASAASKGDSSDAS